MRLKDLRDLPARLLPRPGGWVVPALLWAAACALVLHRITGDYREDLAALLGFCLGVFLLFRLLAKSGRSEEGYRKLFETMSSGVAIYEAVDGGADFRIVALNPAAERIEKVALQDVAGRLLTEVFPGVRDFGIFDALRRVWRTGRAEDIPLSLYKDERIAGWRENRIFKLPSGQVMAVYDDVTERMHAQEALAKSEKLFRESRQTEAALSESQDRFRLFVETCPDAIFVQTEGRFAYINPSGLALFGAKSPNELLGREVLPRFHPAYRELARERIRRINVERQTVPDIEEEILCMDGRAVPVALSAVPFRFQERDGALVFVRDITVRKRMEDRLRRLNDCLLSQTPDATANINMLVSLAGELLAPALALYNRLEGPTLRAVGRWNAPAGLPETFPAEGTVCKDVIARGSPEPELIRGLLDSQYAQTSPIIPQLGLRTYFGKAVRRSGKAVGALCLLFQEDFVPSEEDRKLLGIIAAAVGAEETKLHLEAQFLQAQKMEAVGRLAGGVAHDFNNLLTAIKGYSEFLISSIPAEDPRREDAAEILKAADRAAALTRQLLAFSRRQVLCPVRLNLNDIVTGTTRMLKRLLGEDILYRTDLAPALRPVRVDPGQMEQAILNIVVNARDAMPQGGTLSVATADVDLGDAEAAEFSGLAPVPYAELRISDTGAGMPPEVKSRVFEPFFTTKEKGKGTGLGLSMVYGIVKQSNGDVVVKSAPGQGTTFRILLPVCREGEEPEEPQAAAAEAGAGAETVLVTEDDETVRSMARRSLARRGYTVLEADGGEEALRILGRTKVDLLLTDVIMPDMNGRELARHAAKVQPGIRVLYFSGYTDDVISRHGVLEPGIALLQKPFTPEVLAQKVREALDLRA
ncbi:MAG: PAS domain S-box protein [Elusimicrobia bacterium]|nr:PAS domain S-box protein [Elusimicrobiota bacterium]